MSDAGIDRDALESLYVRLERRVYNVVYRGVWDPHVAQELVQETFVRLWDARARVRPESADALVFTIAANLVRKRRRWARIRAFVGLDDAPAVTRTPEDDALSAEAHHRVRRALEALPDRDREVLLLCQFAELPHREIAAILGVPVGTVGSRRHHALARLRAALEEPP